MNYEEALEYIHSVNWCFCKPGLERIGELCKRLGDPQNELRFIHVAGTNGKGSFCSMLDSVLRAAGVKTGLYTSPYINFFNERMCINGEPISDAELAEITTYVRPIADSMSDKPTEFELITAVAFEYFKKNKCDVVILEAGMGGRLDSTNIISTPILSVITGVALDHTDYLGNTVELIAQEKAGIIKSGIPVLFGGEDETAYEVISKKAHELSSPIFRVSHSDIHIRHTSLEYTEFDYLEHKAMRLSLLGSYQPKNASSVLSAVYVLNTLGINIPDSAVRDGLFAAKWHARFEILSNTPLIIYDGAHNPQGISMLKESIKSYFSNQKVLLVSTVMHDKDYEHMVRELSELTDTAYLFKVNDRALDTHSYAEVYRKNNTQAYECASMTEALTLALDRAKNTGVPLICAGSLYMYADLKKVLDRLL